MKITEIKSCYIGPEISPEQYIPEHMFLFLGKGMMNAYDGNKHYSLHPGEYCLVRKNRLGRYNKQRVNDEFEKVVIIFDEIFLKKFHEKHQMKLVKDFQSETFIKLQKSELVPNFIHSLMPFYDGAGQLDKAFADLKREELLLILLKVQPELSSIFFDFGIPDKINLEAFMNQNFRFNVKMERLAFLTGRSLSSFKRDFKSTFNETPNRWLLKKRLQEAYFLLEKKRQKSTDIYLDLGFEDLSHFSFAFKKQFGITPSQLAAHNISN